MITYNLAPTPFWYFRDQLGEPLANGTMLAYRNTNRSELKPVHPDPSGFLTYLQPIQFDAAGGAGPFYWESDENYYLEIYDANGALVHTIGDYNAPQDGGVTPITNNLDFTNYILDPQFEYSYQALISPLTTSQKLTNSEWYLEKNNTSATDTIQFIEFGVGDVVPTENPARYIQYECTVAGSGESYKAIEFRFPDVRSFQNQQIAIAFQGQASAANPDVEIEVKQFFGTGGGPSPTLITPVATVSLPISWEQRTGTIIVPTTAAKTRGTNGDDYFAISLGLPKDSISRIDLTNIQLNLNNAPLPFAFLGRSLTASSIVPAWDPQLDTSKVLTINGDGIIQWEQGAPIGSIVFWAVDGSYPTGYLPCQGQSLPVAEYTDLFLIYQYKFGGAGVNFNLPDMRGLFARGLDQGRGLDPGRLEGTFQSHALQEHTHSYETAGTVQGRNGPDALLVNTTKLSGGAQGANVANETRPVNFPGVWIVKAE